MHSLAAFALALALAVPAAEPARAQENRPAARRQAAELKERLKLTGEQVEKVRPVLAEQARKAREIREKHKDDRRAARPEIRTLRGDIDAKLKEILTAEQFAEYEKFRAERQRRAR